MKKKSNTTIHVERLLAGILQDKSNTTHLATFHVDIIV